MKKSSNLCLCLEKAYKCVFGSGKITKSHCFMKCGVWIVVEFNLKSLLILVFVAK